jgi:acyl-CoA thioesterase FadM
MRGLTTTDGDVDANGILSKQEIFTYLEKAVAERTHGLQHPTLDRDNPAMSLELPVLPQARWVLDR